MSRRLVALVLALGAIALGTGAGAQPSQETASRVVWAAVEDAGVYRSTDGGEHWVKASTGLPLSQGGAEALCPLVVDPSAPEVAYVVMRSKYLKYDVYKTTDGGRSWRSVFGGAACGAGGTVAIDPQHPQVVYVSGRGLFRSRDGGGHWQNLGARACGDYLGDVTPGRCGPFSPEQLLIDPRNSKVMYAFGSKSTDGGRTWYPAQSKACYESKRRTGRPCGPSYGGPLALDPRHPSVLYAAGEPPYVGVYKSTDAGRTWVQVGRKGLYVKALAVDPRHSNVVWAAGFTSGGGSFGGPLVVDKSTDGGRTWVTKLRRPRVDAGFPRLAIDPGSPSTVYVGYVGVLKTTNGGATWVEKNAGLPREAVVDEFYRYWRWDGPLEAVQLTLDFSLELVPPGPFVIGPHASVQCGETRVAIQTRTTHVIDQAPTGVFSYTEDNLYYSDPAAGRLRVWPGGKLTLSGQIVGREISGTVRMTGPGLSGCPGQIDSGTQNFVARCTQNCKPPPSGPPPIIAELAVE